ncbi:hypothetical protein V8E53_006743 [Lactarius tabidus]
MQQDIVLILPYFQPLDSLNKDIVLDNIRSLKPTLDYNLSQIDWSSAGREPIWVAALSTNFEDRRYPDPASASLPPPKQGDPDFPEPLPAGGSVQHDHSVQLATVSPPSQTFKPTKYPTHSPDPGQLLATLLPYALRRPSLPPPKQGDPDFPEPPAAGGGSVQHDHSVQLATVSPPSQTFKPTKYPTHSPDPGQLLATLLPYALRRPSLPPPKQGDPDFPEPPAASGGSVQHDHSGQSATVSPPSRSFKPTKYPARTPDPGQQATSVSHNSGKGRPAHARPLTCRVPHCKRPLYFDQRFNQLWEWCTTQHIQEGLARGLEKVCESCLVWPRKYGYRYCGGDACNKSGVPISR